MKSKLLFLFSCVWLCLESSAQQKGVAPVSSTTNATTGATYAVVVGISDYQDPAIPDLKYAAKDAEAYAQFLKSKAGGSLTEDHMKVLLNQQATQAQFGSALDWLLEVAKSGDRVIIYFSGHGDVEKKTISQPGFLLCWNSPSRVYMNGGAFPLGFLEEVINTLSIQNTVKVTMVADACHSGKLSGSQIGGAQATATNLARQYSNEIKILSCQPNEFSLEGEQWGGGRGVFSYHLVDGLSGLADQNNDASISLHELTRYLEDKVIPEAAPQSQIPVVIGNKAEKIAIVDPVELASLRKRKEGETIAFVKTESRGLEEQVLSKADSSTRLLFNRFKTQLEQKNFLSPSADCADYYYRLLEKDTSLAVLHGAMRRNFAAALQDDVQDVLNRFLRSELMELSLSKRTAIRKYEGYPAYLERAAELLGENHYMYPVLLARKKFFEGYLLILGNKNKNESLGRSALIQFQNALEYQKDMPHAYWAMNFAYGYNLMLPDSAEYFTEKAVSLVPSWQLPYANLVFLFADKWNQLEKAGHYLKKINDIDSSSLVALYSNGIYYDVKGEFTQAEYYFQKAVSLDPGFIYAHNNLGNIYLNTGKLDSAERHYQKAIALDPEYPMGHSNLGIIYYITGRKSLAESEFLKAHGLDPFGPYFNYNLACYYANDGKMDTGYQYLESALKNGWTNYKYLQEDPEMAPLRSDQGRWKSLMQSFFPDKAEK